jgi:hypothetical protein
MLPIITNTATIGDTGNAYSFALSILVIAFILVVLVLREVLQAVQKDSLRIRIDILNVVIVPLLLTFGVLVILRVVELMLIE